MIDVLSLLAQLSVLSALGLIVLLYPHLGLAFTIASLPIIDLLPPIPLLTSVVPLVGGVTLVGYFFQKGLVQRKRLFRFEKFHLLSGLFLVWLFLSNPQSSWFGVTRNWVLTFFQLWILAWMAGELLDTPEKHRVTMWIFSIVATASALFTLQQQGFGVDASVRATGLAGGANSASRYFVVALIFLSYLRRTVGSKITNIIIMLGIATLTLGVFFTVSRTGILLLFVAIILLNLQRFQGRREPELLVFFVVGLVSLWLLSDFIVEVVLSIIPAIRQGTDTVGLRYGLWQAGWRMWLDHRILGVGIGMFPQRLVVYGRGLVPFHYLHLGAHNMYVQVLAETGLIGFTLFVFSILTSIQNFWVIRFMGNVTVKSLGNVWLIVLLVLLIGGITKHDHYDKLVWFAMGISVYFVRYHQRELQIQENAT